jgi:hypothetical protein
MKNHRRIPPEIINVTVPSNGKHMAATEERLTELERVTLLSLKSEVDQMKLRKALLEKELTLLSADIIRKGDELEVKSREITEKYKLKKGEREIELGTGRIYRPS